jgi:type II secretory pathway pseudopilin PulG
MRPFIVVLGAIVAIFAIIISAIVILLVTGINQAGESAGVAVHFVSSLATRKYEDAYNDLSPNLTIRARPTLEEFTQQAQTLDQRYGKITAYPEVGGSAKFENNIWSYTYDIKREKRDDPYKLTIALKQNENNSWKIISYGQTLGPP